MTTSCALTGISRATHYRHANPKGPCTDPGCPAHPHHKPPTLRELARVLQLLTGPAYRDLAIP
ncbi:MAG TPA: hypothetical protein VJT49_15080 [Amycolatopsis sp.]|uniref:hypothetical protein n=1 Tax=Amycolatopsis sp. TaxID=37632 RepID=UPI002B47C81D|nr:hypothetical protein [Amycolatopsis sp.]HKS46403.1 hypothetical protein [Amycolatopsis sp.]